MSNIPPIPPIPSSELFHSVSALAHAADNIRMALVAIGYEAVTVDRYLADHHEIIALSDQVISAWTENIALEDSFNLRESLESKGFVFSQEDTGVSCYSNDRFLVVLHRNNFKASDMEGVYSMAIHSLLSNQFVYLGRQPETKSEFTFLLDMLNLN